MTNGHEPLTLVDVVRNRAQVTPDARACTYLNDGTEVLPWTSFGEFERQVRAIAARLQDLVTRGDRVLLLQPPGADVPALFHGTVAAGAICIPAPLPDPSRPQEGLRRLGAIAVDADVRVVLAPGAFAPLAEHVRELADRTWVASEEALAADESAWRDPGLGPDDIAYLQYTSGSTGTPKGVMIDHRAALLNAEALRRHGRHGPETLGLCWAPHYHDMGLVSALLEPFVTGYPIALMSPLDFVRRPVRWLQAISSLQATSSHGTNFAYELLLRKVGPEERGQLDLSTWAVAGVGAEPVSAATVERFSRVFASCGFRRDAWCIAYGMAEATLLVTLGDLAPPLPAGEPVPVGRAEEWLDVRIVDPETSVERPPGEEGEIWVRGESLGRGYWNRPEATAETFEARLADGEGPYLRTGDLGTLAPDGTLTATGRHKDVIIVRGRNVHPQDVEWAVGRAHPAVRPGCVAAVAIPCEDEGTEGVAVVCEITPGVEDPATIVREVVATVVRAHDVAPAKVVLIGPRELPKTSSGKIRRAVVREALADGSLTGVHVWQRPQAEPAPERPAGADVERWLRAEVSRRTGVPPVEIDGDRPIGEYGFGSAELVDLAEALERRCGREVRPELLYEVPTIAGLARHLGGEVRAALAADVPAPARCDIAIVGLAARLPGAADADGLWELLVSGDDAMTEVPSDRWDLDAWYDPDLGVPGRICSRRGGFVPGIELFDAGAFGIGNREARGMDPQQRMLLEVAWDALGDALVAPESLAGTATGVFVGASGSDYLRVAEGLSGRDAVNGAPSALANRISYLLDARGPSQTIDTACSSSLVALHAACRSLQDGECDIAVVGGVNALLDPFVSAAFSEGGALAPGGRCRSFTTEAEGMSRAEGCGVLVIKRMSDAEADGDLVRAVVRGSATGNSGRTNGLAAPSPAGQRDVVRAALRAAGAAPDDLAYVETHGTGTPLGDAVEAAALREVLEEDGRRTTAPCVLGAVKAAIGHLEAAAGVAGVVKAVLALEHGEVPAQPEEDRAMIVPDLTAGDAPLRVATSPTPLPAGALVGVSSFGAGGTNAHVILAAAPVGPAPEPAGAASPQLLALSARDDVALAAQAGVVAELLDTAGAPSLAAVAASAATGRPRRRKRIALVAASADDAAAALRAFADAEQDDRVTAGEASRPQVAFLFPGQGAVHHGAGRRLAETEPVFASTVARAARLVGVDPLTLDAASLREPRNQVATVALSCAMTDLFASWGVVPDVVLGHSVGELSAAYASGVLGLGDVLALAVERGRLQADGAAASPGRMAAVMADETAVLEAAGRLPDGVVVAARNGPRHVVLSGPHDGMDVTLRRLEEAGLLARELATGGAGHSPAVDPLLPALRTAAASLRPSAPRCRFASTALGRVLGHDERPDADYWATNMRAPVDLVAGLRALDASGADVLVECGPGTTLTKLGPRCLPGRPDAWLAPMRAGDDERHATLTALGRLWVAGAPVRWDTVHRATRARTRLPAYPWQRRSFWATPAAAEPA